MERVGLATSGPKGEGGFRVILEEARSWHRASSLVPIGPRNQTISDHLAELEVAHPSSHFSNGNEVGTTAMAAAVTDGERPYPPGATPCGSGGASGLSQEKGHLERGGSER